MFLINYSILTKSIVGMLIIGLAISAVVGVVHVKAPYAKNLEVRLTSWDGNTLTFTGSVDINYKNSQAWTDIGYKEGNFKYFYQYWQNQEGKTFSYSGVNVKLIDITMVPTYNLALGYDHIHFTIKLQQK
jgi:hypothetical protein